MQQPQPFILQKIFKMYYNISYNTKTALGYNYKPFVFEMPFYLIPVCYFSFVSFHGIFC